MKNIEKTTNNPETKKRYTSPMIRFIELEECVMGGGSPITGDGLDTGGQSGDSGFGGGRPKSVFGVSDDTTSE